jgi:hypothetical protein
LRWSRESRPRCRRPLMGWSGRAPALLATNAGCPRRDSSFVREGGGRGTPPDIAARLGVEAIIPSSIPAASSRSSRDQALRVTGPPLRADGHRAGHQLCDRRLLPSGSPSARRAAPIRSGELNYWRSRDSGHGQIGLSRFFDWRRHRYRRFKSCEKRFAGIGDLPACFVAHNKSLRKDIQARGACCQPLRPVGPVRAAGNQNCHHALEVI